MKKSVLLFLIVVLLQLTSIHCQTNTLKTMADFLPKEKTQVFVMGTFHFNFPGLDEHKTAENDKIDVLKEPKKSEVTELIAYLKKFNPNKIIIEARTDWNDRYAQYRQGAFRDKRDERYQVAMRLADELGLDSVFSADAPTLEGELFEKDSVLTNSLTEKMNWDIEDPYLEKFFEWADYRDGFMKDTHLLEFLKNMNQREAHNANFGLYLTGAMASDDYDGADKLSIWWYNRNVRIFSNILRLTESSEDRILVIFGNGHAAILRQLFEASPQYEFVEFDSLED